MCQLARAAGPELGPPKPRDVHVGGPTQSGCRHGKRPRVEEKDARERPTCKPETLNCNELGVWLSAVPLKPCSLISRKGLQCQQAVQNLRCTCCLCSCACCQAKKAESRGFPARGFKGCQGSFRGFQQGGRRRVGLRAESAGGQGEYWVWPRRRQGDCQ